MQTSKAFPQTRPNQTAQGTIEPQVPEGLRKLVSRTSRGLTLKSQTHRAVRAPWIAGGLFTALIAGGGLWMALGMLLFALTTGAAPLVLLAAGILGVAAFAGACALVAAAIAASLPPPDVRIDRHGAAQVDPLGKTLRDPTHITIRGEVGAEIEIYLHGKGRMRLVRAHLLRGSGWSLQSLMWFAQAAADQVGVPLNDELDHPAWSRWYTDVPFRQRTQFIRHHEVNLETHPRWHASAPTRSHMDSPSC